MLSGFAISCLFVIGILILGASRKKSNHESGLQNRSFFDKNDYQLYFERMELVRFNKQHVKKYEIVTFKYNRSLAVINMTWSLNIDFGYDFNILVQAYRFASNEYRLFPLRLNINFCEAFKANVMGMQSVLRCGNYTSCPMLKSITYLPKRFADKLTIKTEDKVVDLNQKIANTTLSLGLVYLGKVKTERYQLYADCMFIETNKPMDPHLETWTC